MGGVMNDTPNSPEAARAPAFTGAEPHTRQDNTFAPEGAILQTATPLLRGVLSDAAGNLSSMRVAMLLGVGVVLGAWAAVSIQTRTLQPLPDSVVGLLGLLVAGKFGQKFIEPVPAGNGVAGTSARPNGVGAREAQEEISSKANGAQGEPATGRATPYETKQEEAAQ
jgi:hypothetical protein